MENADTTKQAQKVIFSLKLKKFILHYSLIIPVFLGHPPENTWELYLAISLKFDDHLS